MLYFEKNIWIKFAPCSSILQSKMAIFFGTGRSTNWTILPTETACQISNSHEITYEPCTPNSDYENTENYMMLSRTAQMLKKSRILVNKTSEMWSFQQSDWSIRSLYDVVQSLNSPFFPPYIGARNPGRAKGESRITCMRMLTTPPFFPQIDRRKNNIWKCFPDSACGAIFWIIIFKQQFLHYDW